MLVYSNWGFMVIHEQNKSTLLFPDKKAHPLLGISVAWFLFFWLPCGSVMLFSSSASLITEAFHPDPDRKFFLRQRLIEFKF